MDIFRKNPPPSELGKATYTKIGTIEELESRVDVLEEDSNSLDERVADLESTAPTYTELSLNWYQVSTDNPVIARTNVNTLLPVTAVTTGYLGVGIYTFDFDQDIFPTDRSKVEIFMSVPRAASGTRILAYQIQADNSVIVRSLDFAGAAVDVVGYEPAGTYSTLNIKIYP